MNNNNTNNIQQQPAQYHQERLNYLNWALGKMFLHLDFLNCIYISICFFIQIIAANEDSWNEWGDPYFRAMLEEQRTYLIQMMNGTYRRRNNNRRSETKEQQLQRCFDEKFES